MRRQSGRFWSDFSRSKVIRCFGFFHPKQRIVHTQQGELPLFIFVSKYFFKSLQLSWLWGIFPNALLPFCPPAITRGPLEADCRTKESLKLYYASRRLSNDCSKIRWREVARKETDREPSLAMRSQYLSRWWGYGGSLNGSLYLFLPCTFSIP